MKEVDVIDGAEEDGGGGMPELEHWTVGGLDCSRE